MQNMHPFLSRACDVSYYYLPQSWLKIPGPNRIKILIYLLLKRRSLERFDFILSHIPEGSVVASYTGIPYAHIYHGNANPMTVSRYRFGKYAAFIYERFFKRIEKTAALIYSVGPTGGGIKKLFNPIFHDIPTLPLDERSGFIFAGRLEAPKNIDRIIRIYTSLPADVIGRNDLFIAGTGSQEERLKDLASRSEYSDHIHFLGRMANHDLIEEDSRRLIMLMASEYEGMPTAIAEALSVGVPVVSTSAGDIPSVIRDGVNGYVLPVGCSDEDYRKSIMSALSNIESLSRGACESSSIFDAESIVRDMISDINSVLNRQTT